MGKKQQDREKIVQEIKEAAALYKKYLVGKRFLYVFEGTHGGNTGSIPVRTAQRISLLGNPFFVVTVYKKFLAFP